LFEDQLAADATDQYRQIRGCFIAIDITEPGRLDGAVDQTVEIGLHEPGISPFGDVPRKGHTLLGLIYRQKGAHHGAVVLAHTDTQGKQQSGGRQPLGQLAQIGFVEPQNRFSVQLIEDVALGTGHQPFRTEGIPTSDGTVTDSQTGTVEPDRRYDIPFRLPLPDNIGFAEARAVARQSARNRNILRQTGRQSPDQIAAVDLQPVRENENVHEIIPEQGLTQPFSDGEIVAEAAHGLTGAGHTGVLEMNGRRHEGVIKNTGAEDLARGGTSDNLRPRISRTQGLHACITFQRLCSAKDQHQLRRVAQPSRHRVPSFRHCPQVLFHAHDRIPQEKFISSRQTVPAPPFVERRPGAPAP